MIRVFGERIKRKEKEWGREATWKGGVNKTQDEDPDGGMGLIHWPGGTWPDSWPGEHVLSLSRCN